MANDGVKIAAAMAAGYMLGRTHKARFAFAVVGGVLVAGRGLAKLGLDESRLGAVLTEVLGDVQRSAGEALNSRVGQLSDSLRSQTEGLGGVAGQDDSGEDEEGQEGQDEGADSGSDQGARDEDSDGAGGEEEAPARTRDAGRGARAGGRRVAQAATRGRR